MNLSANITLFWRQRTQAERRTLTLGGAVLAIALLYAFIWHPLSQERQRLQASLPQLRAAAAQMRIQSAEVTSLRNQPKKNFGNSLRSALDYASAHSNVGAPSQTIPLDAGRVRVEFNAAAFDSWIDWVNLLQTEQGIRVESAEIIALAEPGMVKIKAVLASAGNRP
jgi:general secretion pathway protein M